MNVLTMERPVIRTAALDASDTPVIRTAVEACCYYNPSYQPATPHYVKNAFPVAVAVEQDLLAPYAGKEVTLSFHVGYDPATRNVIEMGFDTVLAEKAKAIAVAAATKHKLPVIIKCAESGTLIYTQGKETTGNRVARVTSNATVKVSKGATPEEIAAREEAARVKAAQVAEAARVKAEQAAKAAQEKADKAAAKARAEQIAANAKALAVAIKATRTAPDEGTDNYAIFESLKKEEGATCKELNFEHDERNGNPYGTSNRGWKQIAQKLATTCNHDLYQSVRVCNRTTSVNIVLTPAFKLVSKGEDGGAGWHNITPTK